MSSCLMILFPIWVLYGNRPQAPPSSRAALEVIFNPAALAVILPIFAA